MRMIFVCSNIMRYLASPIEALDNFLNVLVFHEPIEAKENVCKLIRQLIGRTVSHCQRQEDELIAVRLCNIQNLRHLSERLQRPAPLAYRTEPNTAETSIMQFHRAILLPMEREPVCTIFHPFRLLNVYLLIRKRYVPGVKLVQSPISCFP